MNGPLTPVDPESSVAVNPSVRTFGNSDRSQPLPLKHRQQQQRQCRQQATTWLNYGQPSPMLNATALKGLSNVLIYLSILFIYLYWHFIFTDLTAWVVTGSFHTTVCTRWCNNSCAWRPCSQCPCTEAVSEGRLDPYYQRNKPIALNDRHPCSTVF